MESHGQPQREYEFDATQNATIAALSSGMQFCGIFELIIGIVYALLAVFSVIGGAIPNVVIYAITSAIWILLAGMQMRAAGYFRSVVDTQGSDITLLMVAIDHLRGYFGLKRVLYIIGLILIVVGIVLFFLLTMRHKPETM